MLAWYNTLNVDRVILFLNINNQVNNFDSEGDGI